MAVITISREYGSEGDEIAARICELLGYRYFDKTLMARVASEVGLSETEIVDFSEEQHKVRGFLDRLLGERREIVSQARVWQEDTRGVRSLQVAELDPVQSITLVQGTIRAAYKQGDVVIVGRGGQAILKDMPGVLHVRVVAPQEARVRRIQEREGLGLEVAQEIAAKRDKASADYLKRFYGVDWSDSLLYHLILNTGRWGIESASRLIVDAVSLLQPMASPN